MKPLFPTVAEHNSVTCTVPPLLQTNGRPLTDCVDRVTDPATRNGASNLCFQNRVRRAVSHLRGQLDKAASPAGTPGAEPDRGWSRPRDPDGSAAVSDALAVRIKRRVYEKMLSAACDFVDHVRFESLEYALPCSLCVHCRSPGILFSVLLDCTRHKCG